MNLIKKYAWYGSAVVASLAVAAALLLAGPADVAEAAIGGSTPAAATFVPADGTTEATVTATGLTGPTDLVQFTTTVGTFTNGTSSIVVAGVASTATTKIKSATAGAATIAMVNLSSGGNASNSFLTFYGAPVYKDGGGNAESMFCWDEDGDTTGGCAGGTTADDTNLAAATTKTVSPDGVGQLLATIKDAGPLSTAADGRVVAGAPWTLTASAGTFSGSGTGTIAGITQADGTLAATPAQLNLAAGQSATVVLTVNATTGTLTFTAEIVRLGAITVGTVKIDTGDSVIAAGGGAQSVAVVTLTDAGGNTKDHNNEGTATASCTGKSTDGTTNIISAAAIVDAVNGDGKNELQVTPTSGTVAGAVSCTISYPAQTAGDAAISLTAEFAVSNGTASTVTVEGPAEVGLGEAAAYTVTVADASGTPLDTSQADNVTGAVTGATLQGNLIIPSASTAHTDGVLTLTFVNGGQAGTFTITAVTASGKVGFKTVKVSESGGTTPPPSGGTFEGEIAASGVSLVQFVGGGTLADLQAAAEGVSAVSVWTTSGGGLVGFVPGAPAFVNAGLGLSTAYPDALPDPLLVIIVK